MVKIQFKYDHHTINDFFNFILKSDFKIKSIITSSLENYSTFTVSGCKPKDNDDFIKLTKKGLYNIFDTIHINDAISFFNELNIECKNFTYKIFSVYHGTSKSLSFVKIDKALEFINEIGLKKYNEEFLKVVEFKLAYNEYEIKVRIEKDSYDDFTYWIESEDSEVLNGIFNIIKNNLGDDIWVVK